MSSAFVGSFYTGDSFGGCGCFGLLSLISIAATSARLRSRPHEHPPRYIIYLPFAHIFGAVHARARLICQLLLLSHCEALRSSFHYVTSFMLSHSGIRGLPTSFRKLLTTLRTRTMRRRLATAAGSRRPPPPVRLPSSVRNFKSSYFIWSVVLLAFFLRILSPPAS